MGSEPDDGPQTWFLVGVQGLGDGREVGILEQEASFTTNPLQLVIVGLLAAPLVRCLLNGPVPFRFEERKMSDDSVEMGRGEETK